MKFKDFDSFSALNEAKVGEGLKKLTPEQIDWCNNHILKIKSEQKGVNETDFGKFKRKKWEVTEDGKIKVKGNFLIHAVRGPVKTLGLNDTEDALEEIPVQFDKADENARVEIYGPKLKTLKGSPWADNYTLNVLKYFDHDAEWIYELTTGRKKTDPHLWKGLLIYPRNLNIEEIRFLFHDGAVSQYETALGTSAKQREASRLTSSLMYGPNVSELGKMYLESGLDFDEFLRKKRGSLTGRKFGL
jgi:hypothetical protein